MFDMCTNFIGVFYLSFVALQPEDVVKFFEPVFNQAKDLSVAYEGQEHTRVPFVTVCSIQTHCPRTCMLMQCSL